jgi:hypothetical protein
MAQNISSRKQELLSRLKNTLAIVSQATGFDRLDDEPRPSEHRDIDLRQPVDPRSVERRQLDLNITDPRLSHSRLVNHQQVDDEHDRWSAQSDGRLHQFAHRQHWHAEEEDDSSFYQSKVLASGSAVQPRPTAGGIHQPVSTSAFEKLENIEDEDEFLYGKDILPKPTATSQRHESPWPDSARSVQMQDTSPLSQQSSNFSVGLEKSRITSLPPRLQQSSALGISSGNIDVPNASQQQLGVGSRPDSSGSVLGNVNTDMLQNILRLVSQQKPQQSTSDSTGRIQEQSQNAESHLHSNMVDDTSLAFGLRKDERLSVYPDSIQQATPRDYNRSSRDYSRAAHKAHEISENSSDMYESRSYLSVNSRSSADSRVNVESNTVRAGPSVYARQQAAVNQDIASSTADSSTPQTGMFVTKDIDSINKSPVVSSSVRMSDLVSAATMDTKNRMSALLSAVESETSSQMSALVSDAAVTGISDKTNTVFSASKADISDPESKGETFDRLFAMLGCNSNIVSMMQQLIKKGEPETLKKKKQDLPGNEQLTKQGKELCKPEAELVRNEGREQISGISPMCIAGQMAEKVTSMGKGSKEDQRNTRNTIPVVSSLVRLQRNYDSDDDYNPRSPSGGNVQRSVRKSGSCSSEDRMKSDSPMPATRGKDSEWEKSTEEFLRRLQTRKPVQSREKSRSPHRSLRDRPRSPKPSREKSLSPIRQLRERPQSPKTAVKMYDAGSRDNINKTLTSPEMEKEVPAVRKDITSFGGEKVLDTPAVDRPPVVPFRLSDEDQAQLLKAKEELTSTFELLLVELDKLRIERNALLGKGDSRYRSEELQKNISLQQEMTDHLDQLKKALNELDGQLEKAKALEANTCVNAEVAVQVGT